MKTSNLSLAVLVALGTVACGGGGSDNAPSDPQKPSTPISPEQPSNPSADDSTVKVVDPTQTQVVDNKDLSVQESVGTLQYIRREGSNYDRSFNPSQPASASPYLGVHLDDQNPKLTNIVLARQDLQRADGQPVKAQFTGSTNREPLNTDGSVAATQVTGEGNASLQQANFYNVDVLAGAFAKNANTLTKHTLDTVYKNNLFQDGNGGARTRVTTVDGQDLELFSKERNRYEAITDAIFDSADDDQPFDDLATGESLDGVSAVRYGRAPKDTFKDKVGPVALYKDDVAATTVAGSAVVKASSFGTAIPADKTRRYGGNLVWWSAPNNAFENESTRYGSDFEDHGDATTGLVRIGGGMETLGQELNWSSADNRWVDHHNTTTRIFGRYHLAFADQGKVKPVTLNTFVGASSFVAELELPVGGATTLADAVSNNAKVRSYSIGAVPGHLENVQYGRVTTNLDLDLDAKTYGDGFMHQPYVAKNDDAGVDNYFYRGTNATTVAEMAALPTDRKLVYNGHALMYGIDNNYHGQGNSNLPNAFAYGSSGLGLGNFVEATADLATKQLTGTVYNAWLLDPSKAAVTKDVLVNFSGNIVGNSAWGSADRAYVAGDDKADFRASFFGDKAEELGGSFNTVQSIPANGNEAYGSAYGIDDWGGVFGAKQAGSGNTFQGDDGANVYTGLSN